MFHECFHKAFPYVDISDQKLLEIGCGGSAWLPYFAKEFGFEVYDIDYSELGCQQAAQVLENEGVEGEILCADFFSPPEHMLGDFDTVGSRGVVEHFEDTAAWASAFSKFLRPGGVMSLSLINFENLRGTPFYEVAVRLRSWITKAMWGAERTMPMLRPNRWTSAFVGCVTKKPCV